MLRSILYYNLCQIRKRDSMRFGDVLRSLPFPFLFEDYLHIFSNRFQRLRYGRSPYEYLNRILFGYAFGLFFFV